MKKQDNKSLIQEVTKRLDWYTMEASDEEFDADEVQTLLKLLDSLKGEEKEEELPVEEALDSFWKYCEKRQEEERILAADGKESEENRKTKPEKKEGRMRQFLLFAIVYYMCRRLVSFKEAMNCLTQGFIAMVPAMLILTFAVTLKTMTGLLGADVYVAGLMQGASSGLTNMLPAIIFLVACFLAFASGTSWGTFGILIPIVTGVFTDPATGAIVPGAEHLIIIGVSACLAGAVMGDHCSPISDTTIMASAGAQCNHINHVSTQVPYVLTVAAISFVTYIIAGFVQNVVICLVIGILLTLVTLLVLKRVFGQKTATQQ